MMNSELQWDAFWGWIRRKGLVGPGSEKKYQSVFREVFYSLCQADLVTVYGAYRQHFLQNDNTILISMSGSYLQYRLELEGTADDADPARMMLLRDLFQAARRNSIDLDQILDRVTQISGIKKSGFPQAEALRTPRGKLTPDGFYYYSQRHLLTVLRRELHLRGSAAAELSELLKLSCPDEFQLRERLYGFAQLLAQRWGDRKEFHRSGTQQKLLQLISLRSPLWRTGETDPGKACTDLCLYAAELLLDLSADLYASDGAVFGSPAIPTESDTHYWIWLLVLAPFQRIGHMNQSFFLPTGTAQDADSRLISTHLMRLIRNGLLWIFYPPRATAPQIRLIPCAYRLLVGRETALPELLWKMQGKNASNADRRDASEMALLRKLLRRLCADMTRLQVLSAKTLDTEQLPELEQFEPAAELALILASAPRRDERHRSTVCALLRVQSGCYWIRSLGHDLEQINTACIRLKELADAWGDSFEAAVKTGDFPFLRMPYGLRSLAGRLRMHHAQRILEELCTEAREVPGPKGTKYAIFAEQSARESLAAAVGENNSREVVRSACAQLRARLYQLTHMGVSQASDASVMLDYLLPAWRLLRQAREQYLMEQMGAEYRTILSPGAQRSAHMQMQMKETREEIFSAAALYNQICSRFSGDFDTEKLLRFDPEASLEALKRQDASVNARADDLIREIKTAAPVLWRNEHTAAAADYRSFHQDWFLSDQDSAFVTNRENIELSKRHLMSHLLSAQNAVFTVNQIMDNRAIREMVWNPAFLYMVQKGKVAVSLYGNIYDLVQYAAGQMVPAAGSGRKPFYWSSLSESFNSSTAARQEAAEYLRGQRKSPDLAMEFRDEVVAFADGLRVLNEAIPYDVRSRHYQRSSSPNMIETMNGNYDWLERQGKAPEVCMIHRAICGIIGSGGYRTDYKYLLDLCRRMDGPELTLEQGRLLEMVSSFADPAEVLSKAEFLLNDLYNRMLANTFTQLADFTYTREQRQLLRYDETKPISDGGCVLYQQSYTLTDTGTRIDWSGLVDRAAAQDEIIRLHPEIRPEDMVRILGDTDVEYDIQESADGSIMRTKRVVLRTDDAVGADVLLELADGEEKIHMETGKDEHK